MEPLDRELAKALADGARPPGGPARVLVVGRDAHCRTHLVPALATRDHHCLQVDDPTEATAAVARDRFDLIVLSVHDGDGRDLDLLSTLQRTSPWTRAIVVADRPSLPLAVRAMRHGAVDLLAWEACEPNEFLERVDAAVVKARVERQREERIARLKRICQELNVARREVSEQVDLLCRDLAAAYEDIGAQMNDVAMTTEFRTLIQQELDVEDLLRTTLEYMLTKTGPTNAAVFLADHTRSFGLGAYVNYDCPKESVSLLLEHLCHAICPQMADEREIVSFEDAEEFARWIGIDAGILADSQVIAFSCRHAGECLAVFVLFRQRGEAFDEELAATIEVLRTVFSRQLAEIIKIHHRAQPAWPPDPCDDEPDFNDDYGFGVAA